MLPWGAGRGVGRGPGVGAPAGRGPGAGAGREAPCGEGAPCDAPGEAGGRGARRVGPPSVLSASVNLRTTGASIVEDAERTNSPSSWSLAMTTLLSTPNSLASSYTRTFATSLLLVRGWSSAGPSLPHVCTHRVLIECSSQSRPTSDSRGTASLDLSDRPLTTHHRSKKHAVVPSPAAPARAKPERTPCGAPPGPGTPDRDADALPARAFGRGDRGHKRPRPPRPAIGRPWPHAADNLRTFGTGKR
ncbi:hypothetical protein EHYA_04070 [Embleya hyalina]|uniref:Uncharacterized protein n=1 Tax=Embleya hyalina TaxID=516124 RepID=A0A401YP80_9ACTN|nr:hypothetical protein EHYA_04070 [Embleya hyalina]